MGIKLSLDSLFGPDDSLPECAYGCGYDDEEMLFRHKGELTCATCLESYEGIVYNHATKRYRKVEPYLKEE